MVDGMVVGGQCCCGLLLWHERLVTMEHGPFDELVHAHLLKSYISHVFVVLFAGI